MTPKALSALKQLFEICDGILSPTEDLCPLLKWIAPEHTPVEFIPTPYPLHLSEQIELTSNAAKQGIFIGTRETHTVSRHHIHTLAIARELSEVTGRHVTFIDSSSGKSNALLKTFDLQSKPFETLKPLSYLNYLKTISKHEIVIQLDESHVPGQVAGDCLLAKTCCIGGNGQIERMTHPCPSVQPSELYQLALERLKDPASRDLQVSQALSHARERCDYGLIRRRIEEVLL
jgi:hypothetical protein